MIWPKLMWCQIVVPDCIIPFPKYQKESVNTLKQRKIAISAIIFLSPPSFILLKSARLYNADFQTNTSKTYSGNITLPLQPEMRPVVSCEAVGGYTLYI